MMDIIPLFDFDPQNSNPKVLGKIMWYNHTGSLFLSHSSKLEFNHNYTKRQVGPDRYQMLNPSNWADGGGDPADLAREVKDEINKYGGMMAYTLLCSMNRDDAMGRLYKWKNHWVSYPGQGVPCKMCNWCGMINFFSRFDMPPTKVHKTMWNKDLFEDKGIMDGDILDEEWRCGACFGDLSYTTNINNVTELFEELDVEETSHIVGGLLDQLKTIKATDFYADVDQTTRLKMLEHDLAIIKTRMYMQRDLDVPVGKDFDAQNSETLKLMGGNRLLMHLSNYNTPNPELTGSYELILSSIMSSYKDESCKVIGALNRNSYYTNLHVQTHAMTSMSVDDANYCNGLTCDHDIGRVIIGPLACVMQSELLYDIIIRQNSTHMICFNECVAGVIEKHIKPEGKILALSGTNVTDVVNENSEKLMSYADIIQISGHNYLVQTMFASKLLVHKIVSGPITNVIGTLPFLDEHNDVTLEIPLPDWNSVMGSIPVFNIRKTKVTFNINIFHELCLRNITGDASYDDLIEIGRGLAARKFVFSTGKVYSVQLSYEEIKMHALVSLIVMQIQRSRFNLQLNFLSILQKWKPIMLTLTIFQQQILNSIFSSLSKMLGESTVNIMISLVDLIAKPNLIMFIKNMVEDNCWDDLLSISKRVNVRYGRVVTDKSTQFYVDPKTICNHHKPSCNHVVGKNRCMCCGAQCINILCTCCDTSSINISKMYQNQLDDIFKSNEKIIKLSLPLKLKNRSLTVPVGNDPVMHEHTCPRCNNKYKHSHTYNKITHEMDDKDCPTCNPNNKNINSEITNVDATKINKVDKPLLVKFKSKASGSKEVIKVELPSKTAEGEVKLFSTAAAVDEELVKDLKVLGYGKKYPTIDDAVRSIIPLELALHMLETVNYLGQLNKGSFMYNLPHMRYGVSEAEKNSFEVRDYKLIPNTTQQSCGFDVLNSFLKEPKPLGLMMDALGRQGPLTIYEMTDLAQMLELNVIIVAKMRTLIVKSNDSNMFNCVALSNVIPSLDYDEHYVACSLLLIKDHGLYLQELDNRSDKDRKIVMSTINVGDKEIKNVGRYYNVIIEANLYYERFRMEKNTGVWIKPKLMRNKAEVIWTNCFDVDHKIEGSNYGINGGLIKIKVDKWLEEALLMLELPYPELKQYKLYNESYNMVTANVSNVFEDLKHMVTDQIRQFCLFQSGSPEVMHMTYKNKPSVQLNNKGKFVTIKLVDLDPMYLKIGDIVGVMVNGIINYVPVINVLEGEYVLGSIGRVLDKSDILIPKQSFASLMKYLNMVFKAGDFEEQLKHNVGIMKCYLGAPGSGKTQHIVENCTESDLIVCQSAKLRDSIKSRRKNKVTVTTIESSTNKWHSDMENLYIDECTQLTIMDCVFLLSKTWKSITIYGDDTQIKRTDMSSTSGVRVEHNITDYVSEINRNTFLNSYRIGEPLSNELNKLFKFNSKANHKTSITFYNMEVMDPMRLKAIVAKVEPDLIMTPYNVHVHEIIKITGFSNVKTTHGCQGMDVSKALLVLDHAKRYRNLTINPNYLKPGLTRARDELHFINIGLTENITKLSDIWPVGGAPSSRLPDVILQDFNPKNFHKLPECIWHHLTSIGEVVINGYTVKYEGTDERSVSFLDGEPANITVINTDGEMSYKGSIFKKFIAKMIMQANKGADEIHASIPLNLSQELCDLIDEANAGEVIEARTEVMEFNHNFDLSQITCVRSLAWIIESICNVNGLLMNVKYTLHGEKLRQEVLIKKTEGCTYACGLQFYLGNEKVLEIGDQYNSWYYRKVIVHPVAGLTDELLSWFGIVQSNNNGPFVEVSNDCMLYWNMLKERLMLAPLYLIHDKKACMSNMHRARGLVRMWHPDKAYATNWNTYSIHRLHICYEENDYTLYDKSTKIKNYGSSLSSRRVKEIISMLALELSGSEWLAGDEALFLDEEDHMDMNDNVRTEIIKSRAKTLVSKGKVIADQLFLNQTNNNHFGPTIRMTMPKLQISGNNLSLPCVDSKEVLDQLMIMHATTRSNNSKFGYIGSHPHLIGLQTKYHIIPVRPDEFNTHNASWYRNLDHLTNMAYHRFKNYEGDQDDLPKWVTKNKLLQLKTKNQVQGITLLYGCQLTSLNINSIKETIKTNSIIGWVILDVDQSKREFTNGTEDKKFKSWKGDDVMMECSTTINMTELEDELSKNNDGVVTVLYRLSDCLMVRIEKGTMCNWVNSTISQPTADEITIKVPWLTLDLATIATTRNLINMRTMKIDSKMYKVLQLRLLSENVGTDSILDATRTLAATLALSDSMVTKKFNVSTLKAMHTAMLAIYMHYNMQHKVVLLIKAVEWCNSNKCVELFASIAPIFLEMCQMLGETVSSEVVDRMSHWIGSMKIGVTVNECVKAVNDLNILDNDETLKLRKLRPTIDLSINNTIEDDDDDEDENRKETDYDDDKPINHGEDGNVGSAFPVVESDSDDGDINQREDTTNEQKDEVESHDDFTDQNKQVITHGDDLVASEVTQESETQKPYLFTFWTGDSNPCVNLCMERFESMQDHVNLEIINQDVMTTKIKSIVPRLLTKPIANQTDFYRWWCLYNYGGIWVDASVLMINDFRTLMKLKGDHQVLRYAFKHDHDMVWKYESWLMICNKGNSWAGRVLELSDLYYNGDEDLMKFCHSRWPRDKIHLFRWLELAISPDEREYLTWYCLDILAHVIEGHVDEIVLNARESSYYYMQRVHHHESLFKEMATKKLLFDNIICIKFFAESRNKFNEDFDIRLVRKNSILSNWIENNDKEAIISDLKLEEKVIISPLNLAEQTYEEKLRLKMKEVAPKGMYKTMIMSYGTLGDLLPMLSVAKSLPDQDILFVCHPEHVNYINYDKMVWPFTSKSIAQIALNTLGAKPSFLTGLSSYVKIIKEMEKFVNSITFQCSVIIAVDHIPLIKNIQALVKGNLILLRLANWNKLPVPNLLNERTKGKAGIVASNHFNSIRSSLESMCVNLEVDNYSKEKLILAYDGNIFGLDNDKGDGWIVPDLDIFKNDALSKYINNNECIIMTMGSMGAQQVLSEINSLYRKLKPLNYKMVWIGELVPELVLNNVIFDAIFDKFSWNDVLNVRFMVTHGGVGTTMGAIMHHIPTIILPTMGDQYSNSLILKENGLAIVWKDALTMSNEVLLHEINKVYFKECVASKKSRSCIDIIIKSWLESQRELLTKPILSTFPGMYFGSVKSTRCSEVSLSGKGNRLIINSMNTFKLPVGEAYCVSAALNCFNLVINGVQWYDVKDELTQDMIKPLVNRLRVKEYLTMIGVNWIIVTDRTSEIEMLKINNKDWYAFKISDWQEISHIEPIDTLVGELYSDARDLNESAGMIVQNDEFMEKTRSFDSVGIWNYLQITGDKNAVARFTSRKLDILNMRRMCSIYYNAAMNSGRIVYLRDKLIRGYYLVVQNAKHSIMYADDEGEGTVIYCDNLLSKGPLCIMVLGLTTKVSDKQLIQSVPRCVLNNMTRMLYPVTKGKDGRKTVSKGMIIKKVIVAHYDNRDHHNNIETEVIYNDEIEKEFTCRVNLSKLKSTHNKCYDRLVIYKDKTWFCIEGSSVTLTKMIKMWFDARTHKFVPCEFGLLYDEELDEVNSSYMIDLQEIFTVGSPGFLPKITLPKPIMTFNDLNELCGECAELCKKMLGDGPYESTEAIDMNAKEADSLNLHSELLATTTIGDGIAIPHIGKAMVSVEKGGAGPTKVKINIEWNNDKYQLESQPTEQLFWKDQDNATNPNKFNLRIKSEQKNKSIDSKEIIHAEMLNALELFDVATSSFNPCIETENLNLLPFSIAPYTTAYPGCIYEPLFEWTPIQIIDLYRNNDLSNWCSMYAPTNKVTITTKEFPTRIIELEKITLTKYPEKSRPVLQKAVFEEGRSITGRLMSVNKIRTSVPDPKFVIRRMAKAYFVKEWRTRVSNNKNDLLIINSDDVAEWVNASKNAPRIAKELIKTLTNELLTKPLNDVNIHLKLESLLKTTPITDFRQQQARIIVWQRKAVTALYARLFNKAKMRFKELLRDEIVYTDGLKPSDIANRLRMVKGGEYFFENDLTKQDKQTDEHIIDIEFMIYELLGVAPAVLSSWRWMHDTWKFQSKNCRGIGHSMRLTGQATTALGNAIVNLIVHTEFVIDNINNIKVMLVLGDDNAAVLDKLPSKKHLKHHIATKYNMASKEQVSKDYATFCSMIMGKSITGGVELGPDYVRLKNRFEVTNGVGEATDINFVMRSMSYAMMIGNTKEIKEWISRKNLPIKPTMWYNRDTIVGATSKKYDTSDVYVLSCYKSLCAMLNSDYYFRHKFLISSN
jgi:hypothetical protein